MDVIWLILDSLSFDATPFAEDGPETMPKLERLAEKKGIIFCNAYAPGPTSPSSHSSFFTGELPSSTGMHEANPYFTKNIPTIADALSDMSRFAISSNPFLFNGLCNNFDEIDDLRSRKFVVFESGSDPIQDGANVYAESKYKKYLNFLLSDGRPLRSLINGVSYKIHQNTLGRGHLKDAPLDQEGHQFTNTMNERIRKFVDESSTDSFVVANYMDVHAPLDASEKAVQQFSPSTSRENLPIGVSGQEIHKLTQKGDKRIGELMYDLYKAAIWDLDRKLAPLVREFVDDGAFVIVTSDHGNWFMRDSELEERRIHVPLILFPPKRKGNTINKTVNLRSLPRTTMEVARDTDGGFKGVDLTTVTDHQLSVTELIHYPDTPGSPVDPLKRGDKNFRYDMTVIKGKKRVDYIDGGYLEVRGDYDPELRTVIKELRSRDIGFDSVEGSVDSATVEHLRQLGYVE